MAQAVDGVEVGTCNYLNHVVIDEPSTGPSYFIPGLLESSCFPPEDACLHTGSTLSRKESNTVCYCTIFTENFAQKL
jgi:hypothetical protein